VAFRWDDYVQEVRQVKNTEVVNDMHTLVREIPQGVPPRQPLMALKLGRRIPTRLDPLPCGTNYQSARLWVPLDVLVRSSSLKDALAESKRRQSGNPTAAR
jgi:hypothetical protein